MNRHVREETLPAALLRQPGIERVAVFRALQLGDMLCAVPALRALRASLPHAHITLVGLPWAAWFAARYPRYIDDFRAFPGHPQLPEQPADEQALSDFYAQMRQASYTLALQMHGSGEISNGIVRMFGARYAAGFTTGKESGKESGGIDWHIDADADARDDPRLLVPYPADGAEPLRLLRLITSLGGASAGPDLEFPLTDADRDELRRSGVAQGLEPGRYLCIHPGARFRDKCWPPHCFAEVADRLAQQTGLQVVLTGSAKEADLTREVARRMRTPAIDTASPLSIGAMAALMADARLLVCNDTGVSHIAAGLKLKSVVVFSKADVARWAPLDASLHRCIVDADARRTDAVLEQARSLLGAA